MGHRGLRIGRAPRRRRQESASRRTRFLPGGFGLEDRTLLSADPGTAAPAVVPTDSTTQGNWVGTYGGDGYWVPNDAKNLPAYASGTTLSGTTNYTWANPTTDPRALQLATNTALRGASAWYSTTTETFTIPITDGKPHEVSIYLLDWDTTGRVETVQLYDAGNNPIGTAQSYNNFHKGAWYNFQFSGTETIKVTNTGPSNAVVSGLFFSPLPGFAGFVGIDTTTQGNWQSTYGAGGYYIPNDPGSPDPVPPPYATVTLPPAANDYTWSTATTDPRALLQAGSSVDRVASCWYSTTSESFGINITDGNGYDVSLYLLDWDTSSRVEQVQVIDANTGAVLNTRNISGFHGGEYLTWRLQGNLTIKVTDTGPSNAVVGGLFFSTSGVGGIAGPANIDTTTQGNWQSTYGAGGYYIPNDPGSPDPVPPPYATVTLPPAANDYTWSTATTDPRALLQAGSSVDRVASCWYSTTSESFGVNITDGNAHLVSLYLLDWDTTTRVEQVQVINAYSGAVLTSQYISGFHGGEYLTLLLQGDVTIKVYNAGPSNAVVGGLFFAASDPPNTIATFNGTNGVNPIAGLTPDASGNFYGTTAGGGANGDGTVFEIAAGTHTLSTIATFDGNNGMDPVATLTLDAQGNLYGTTKGGGAVLDGTVFEITAGTHALTTIATFNGTNGAKPYDYGGLVLDAQGNLYGTTAYNGANGGVGTAFEIAADTHALTTIATFSFDGTTGASPTGGLTLDASGNLYGTTAGGPGVNGHGTVFEIAAGTHALSTIATFNVTNGDGPQAGLTLDASGNLYGTTQTGGVYGDGTVFEIAAGTHALSTIATFNGFNGLNPIAGLTLDAQGNLYGTTEGAIYAFGTVFKIAAGTHVLSTIAAFNLNLTNGEYPWAALTLDASGNLYGTTTGGGANGYGTVFEIPSTK